MDQPCRLLIGSLFHFDWKPVLLRFWSKIVFSMRVLLFRPYVLQYSVVCIANLNNNDILSYDWVSNLPARQAICSLTEFYLSFKYPVGQGQSNAHCKTNKNDWKNFNMAFRNKAADIILSALQLTIIYNQFCHKIYILG